MKFARIGTMLALLFISSAYGQTVSESAGESLARWGNPKIERFYSNETDIRGAIKSITTLPNGELAVLNGNNLVTYDGTHWESLPDLFRPMGSISVESNKTMIVAFAQGLVELRSDSTGSYSQKVLTPPEKVKLNVDSLETIAMARGSIFGLRGTDLVELDERLDIHHHKLPSWASSVFSIGDEVYVTGGLTTLLNRWDWEAQELVDNSIVYNDSVYEWVTKTIPRSDGGVWMLTDTNKILGFDGERSWIWPGSNVLAEYGSKVRCFVETSPNTLAVGTLSEGLMFFDEAGQLEVQLTKDHGLDDISIEQIGMDGQRGLWISTKRSLSRIQLDYQTLVFDERHGVTDTVNAIAFFQDKIYLGTNVGLFSNVPDAKSMDELFELVSDVRDVGDLIVHGDHLFIAGSELLTMDRRGEIQLIHESGGTSFCQPSRFPDVMLVGHYQGVLRLDREGDSWSKKTILSGPVREVTSIAEAGDGTLWGGLGNAEMLRIRLDDTSGSLEVFTIPSPMRGAWSMPVEVNGQVYINSNPALRWDVESQDFVEDLGMKYYVGDAPYGFEQVYGWSRDNAYVCINARQGKTVPRPNDRVIGDISSLGNSIDTRALCLVYDEQGDAWIGGSFGLARAKSPLEVAKPLTLKPRIHKLVSIKNGDLLLASSLLGSPLVLNPSQDSLHIEIEFGNLVSSQHNQYQIFVEGIDAVDSGYSQVVFRDLTNLEPGDYKIRVNARNSSGQTSPDLELPFTLLAHWYERPVAFFAYAIGVVLLVLAIVHYNARRHVARERELTLIVEERTSKLARQNAQLEERTEELQQTTTSLTETLNQLEEAQDQLVATARTAGKAEVATNVLHNVGNVLNSVNVSLNLLAGKVANSKVSRLSKLADLVESQQDNIEEFLTQDQRGKAVPEYLIQVARKLEDESLSLADEISSMENEVEHIKQIIVAQQTHAKSVDVDQEFDMAELCETAFTILGNDTLSSPYEVIRDFSNELVLKNDKHRVLEIVLNLIRNALDAISSEDPPLGILTLSGSSSEDGSRISLSVIDNGIGISPEIQSQLFRHGFTTKKNGHGFGLHSAANAANALGGSLNLTSRGVGKGATATLILPVKRG